MRVTHVIDALGLGGGAEHSLVALLPALQERGIESSVVCLAPREGGLQAQVAEMGYPVTVLRRGSVRSQARELRTLLAADAPDIVHASVHRATLVARIARRKLPIPLVITLVNVSYDPVRTATLDIGRLKLDVLRLIDGWSMRRWVDRVHALTEVVATEASHVLHVRSERISMIPRGRDPRALGRASSERRAASRARLSINDQQPVFLNVGREDKQKAQTVLLNAFAGVARASPDALLVIAGRRGNASADLDAAVAELGLEAQVLRLGNRDDVADLLAAADVFVFPSHYEGLGCSLIEAMAVGTPIIGSDAPAIVEVLDGGEFGRIVPRGQVEALSDAMAQLMASKDDQLALSTAARQQFEQTYALEVVAAQVAQMYMGLARR